MAYEAPENLKPEDLGEHRQNVHGIFGDTDTSGDDPALSVPTAQEENAGTDVAEAEEQAGEDENVDVAAARRQSDAAAGDTFAEDVDAGAEEQDADAEGDDDADDKTAAEVVSEIESASTVEEVDALAEGDERKTVQKAADKKRDELNA